MRLLINKMFLGLILAALASGPGQAQTVANDAVVRVALVTDVPFVSLEIKGEYQLVDPADGKLLYSGRRLRHSRIEPSVTGIYVDSRFYPVRRLRFVSNTDAILSIPGRACAYHGSIDVFITEKQQLLVVNTLGLEEYVQGVVYREMSHRWPMEALKSQAVISRTYAIYQILRSSKRLYDLTGDIYSQVYGGSSGERFRTNLAVERTAGEVMTFKGKVFPAYFHAACGGYTEDAAELWEQNVPGLLAGRRCGFCGHSPHSWWKKNIQLKEIESKLNVGGYKVGAIKDIFVQERNQSGRIRKLEIVDREDKRVSITGKDFRNIVGPNLIRSNDYYVIMRGYYADFVGRGWGHGVGLCQWGAHGMASKGQDYRQILNFYYSGIAIADYHSLPEFQKK